MSKNGTLGHIGGALLLDARETREREIPKLSRFFAQFTDDRLGGTASRDLDVGVVRTEVEKSGKFPRER